MAELLRREERRRRESRERQQERQRIRDIVRMEFRERRREDERRVTSILTLLSNSINIITLQLFLLSFSCII